MTGLLPWADEMLAKAQEIKAKCNYHAALSIPPDVDFFKREVRFLNTRELAHSFVIHTSRTSLTCAALDFEFGYAPGAEKPLKGQKSFFDIRMIQPLLCSIAVVEQDTGHISTAVFDVRIPEVVTELAQLLRLPVTFVGHYLPSELFCLWQLELPEINTIWDTLIAEKALNLGKKVANVTSHATIDSLADQIEADEMEKDATNKFFRLTATCERYGIEHAFKAQKTELQKSFLSHQVARSFTQEQIEYAAEDSITAAKLYLLQVQKATTEGLLHALITIEMPWVITTAKLMWQGVKIDPSKIPLIQQKGNACLQRIGASLKQQGLNNPNSPPQVKAFFENHGLLQYFSSKDGKYSFDKQNLAKAAENNPLIAEVLKYRETNSIIQNSLLHPSMISSVDNRIHANFVHLGAATGRQSCTRPNLLAVPPVLRPLIVPDDGYGIGEVDFCQIEPGIAGAVFNNVALINMYNSGDVYSSMAQIFFKGALAEDDVNLAQADFKARYKSERQQMKVCTLGIIYGLGKAALAQKLNISPEEAEQMYQQFLDLFPGLAESIKDSIHYSKIRGFSLTSNGFKRYIDKKNNSNVDNWLKNHPVQGSAASVFKLAGNRLDKIYKHYGARLLIPVHDSFVFEAPLDSLTEVARITGEVMEQAVIEMFPVLNPQVDINIKHPSSWNKDGEFDAIENWS